MSDCGVCLGGYEPDGYCDFQDIRWQKARKEHRCKECRRTIQPGERYQVFSGKFDGDFFSDKTCAGCAEIRDCFTCDDGNAPAFGLLMEDLQESVFPMLTTACFAKMKTTEGREHLRSLWMKWKGLAL